MHQYSHYRGSRRRTEKGPEKIFGEIIVGNFPNMGKEIATQVQEVQRVPGRINPRRNTLRHKGKMTNNIQGNSHKVNS